MEEKRNYVIYAEVYGALIERVVSMNETQAKAIEWFMDRFNIDGSVELPENYVAEEI
jgi:hypothetical protein